MQNVFTGTLGLSKSFKPPKQKVKGGKISNFVFNLASSTLTKSLFNPKVKVLKIWFGVFEDKAELKMPSESSENFPPHSMATANLKKS